MKLATLKDGSRDGVLAVVSRDLATAHHAVGIATTLQQVLDDWNFVSPQLEDLYATLNGGKARHAFPFDPRQCMAPLPRAFGWLEGDAGEITEGETPLAPGASDAFLGPCDDLLIDAADAGLTAGGGLAALTGDIAAGADADAALDGVRLLLLYQRWTLRALEAAERAAGRGLRHSRPATAFAPVAVTPEELGGAWRGGRATLELEYGRNGRRSAAVAAVPGMGLPFGRLLAQAVRWRGLRAGSLVGTGVFAAPDDGPDGGLAAGDRLRLQATAAGGQGVFGAIEQQVRSPRTEAPVAPTEAPPEVPPEAPLEEPPARAESPPEA